MLARCVHGAAGWLPTRHLTSRASCPCQLGSDVLPVGAHMTKECELEGARREAEGGPERSRDERRLTRTNKSKGNCAESTEHSILRNVPGGRLHD
jgi:hypothetical protein